VQGAEKVMDNWDDLISIFLAIPSMQELERRLRGRGTETEDKIQGRLSAAGHELTRAHRYQYIVLNDEVERAVSRINAIIDAEYMRYPRMKNTVLEVLDNVGTE
jgi:guanylate kinase